MVKQIKEETKTPNLFELDQTQKDLMELLFNYDDSDEIQKETLETMLKDIQNDIENKIDSYVHVYNSLKAHKEFYSKQIQYLQNKENSIENNINRIKDILFNIAFQKEDKQLLGKIFKCKIQKSPHTVNIITDEFIPEKFKTYSTKVNNIEDLKKQMTSIILNSDPDEDSMVLVLQLLDLIFIYDPEINKKDLIKELKPSYIRKQEIQQLIKTIESEAETIINSPEYSDEEMKDEKLKELQEMKDILLKESESLYNIKGCEIKQGEHLRIY